MKGNKLPIIILSTLLLLAAGYIAYDTYQEEQAKTTLTAYQQGQENGYAQAITQLYSQVQTCKPVPIYIENNSLTLIAVECLQQAQQQQLPQEQTTNNP